MKNLFRGLSAVACFFVLSANFSGTHAQLILDGGRNSSGHEVVFSLTLKELELYPNFYEAIVNSLLPLSDFNLSSYQRAENITSSAFEEAKRTYPELQRRLRFVHTGDYIKLGSIVVHIVDYGHFDVQGREERIEAFNKVLNHPNLLLLANGEHHISVDDVWSLENDQLKQVQAGNYLICEDANGQEINVYIDTREEIQDLRGE